MLSPIKYFLPQLPHTLPSTLKPYPLAPKKNVALVTGCSAPRSKRLRPVHVICRCVYIHRKHLPARPGKKSKYVSSVTQTDNSAAVNSLPSPTCTRVGVSSRTRFHLGSRRVSEKLCRAYNGCCRGVYNVSARVVSALSPRGDRAKCYIDNSQGRWGDGS